MTHKTGRTFISFRCQSVSYFATLLQCNTSGTVEKRSLYDWHSYATHGLCSWLTYHKKYKAYFRLSV